MKFERPTFRLGIFAFACALPIAARGALLSRVESPRAPLAGGSVPVRVTLEEGGRPVGGPAEFYLTASGSAVFAAEAVVGTVVSGGGTGRVLLRSQGGAAEILLSDGVGEVVSLTTEDGTGQVIHQRTLEDFERGDGGFLHAGFGDSWEWGVPLSGPRAAFSGQLVWATNLTGESSPSQDSYLQTPVYGLPESPAVSFEFSHWFWISGRGQVLISVDGGDFSPVLGLPDFERGDADYRQESVDLSPFAGKTVQFRFRLFVNGFSAPGWYIDDVWMVGTRSEVRFLDPALDQDGDRLSNGDEAALGTNSFIADSDGDGLTDRAETNTGIFVSADDAGTDPLDSDSDDGGELDGVEVRSGRDPLDPGDDLEVVSLGYRFTDSDGTYWDIRDDGSVLTRDAILNGLSLAVGNQGFPRASTALLDRNAESLWIGPVTLADLEVTRNVFVPRTGPSFVRYLETFHNPGTVAVTRRVMIQGQVGFRERTQLAATSSGDAVFDDGDDWVVTKKDTSFGNDTPAAAFVVSDPGGLIRHPGSSFDRGNFGFIYQVTVPPGKTVAILHFASLTAAETAAIAKAQDLRDLGGRALDGLRGTFEVLNFGPDRDRDGLPDRVELAAGLDPSDASDAAGDLDADGLTNLEEYRAGSDLLNPDSDGDTLSDGQEVHERGTDPNRADTDGDGTADALDPFPQARVIAKLELPPAAIVGQPAMVGVRLTADGAAITAPVRFTLSVAGPAVFGERADAGTVLSGGRTSAVVLESLAGFAAIDLRAAAPERLRLKVTDHAGYGLYFQDEEFEDFERSDGGFTHGGKDDEWAWKTPGTGPGMARSGSRAWANSLERDYRDTAYNYLETPSYALAAVPGLKLRFWHWFASASEYDSGTVSISLDGGEFADFPGLAKFRSDLAGYNPVTLDLSPYAGHSVKFRFDFLYSQSKSPRGWFIDDLRIWHSGTLLEALEPGGDADGDSLGNAAELAGVTSPVDPDTDADGLSDAVETGNGVFLGEDRTGTDPARRDGDGGGMSDGEEVILGLDPFDRRDDWKPVELPRLLRIGPDFNWEIRRAGQASGDSLSAISVISFLSVGGLPLPEQTAAFGSADGRSLLLGPFALGGLDAYRYLHAPGPGRDFCRYLEILRNRGGVAALAEVGVRGVVGFGDFTEVFATADGDFDFSAGDDWLVTTSQGAPGGKAVGLVASGGGGLLRHATAELARRGAYDWSYRLEVPPGGAAAVAHFALQSAGGARATAQAGEIARLEGAAAEGIAPLLVRKILNFPFDSDGDRIPDLVESALGLDPDDPADGEEDPDGDGLENALEYLSGADLRNPDTDGDGLTDGHEVLDLGSDPTKVDSDGDGTPDGQDPYPSALVLATIVLPATAELDLPAAVLVRLTARGSPVAAPVRFTLKTGGSATFASQASSGVLIAGGGTGAVVLESSGGEAGIALHAHREELLDFTIEDSASVGLTYQSELVEDFEAGGGGFIHGGLEDQWNWGVPTWGPGAARSGRRVWGTDLHADLRSESGGYLESPPLEIPATGKAACSFWHWLEMGRTTLKVSADGGAFEPVSREGDFLGSPGGYRHAEIDLSPYAGKRVRLRFSSPSGGSGWYLDDFQITGSGNPVRVIDPGNDLDGDGIATAEERGRGTSPWAADTDGDELADGVETGTGSFNGPADAGTDPVKPDTDGGGQADGLEVLLALDPLSPADDLARDVPPASLKDGGGYVWKLNAAGGVERPLVWSLVIDGDFFPNQTRAWLDRAGEFFFVGPSSMGGLRYARHVFVPSSGEGFLRVIELAHNPGPGEATARWGIGGDVGTSSPKVIASSSGDRAADVNDDWFITEATTSLPGARVLFVLCGPDAPLRPNRVNLSESSGSFSVGYEAPVAAGTTVAVQYYLAIRPDTGSALLAARAIHRREGRARDFLPRGIPILNFPRDTDGDGIPDLVEVRENLDPRNPLDAGLDPDGDGLTNLEEFFAGTGLGVADTDGDGLTDGVEVHDSLTDPRKADTDGDGVGDATDPFPVTRIVALPDLPRWALTGTPVPVGVSLVAGDQPWTTPVVFGLRAPEGSTFAAEAGAGELLEGGGTGAVVLRSGAEGKAQIALTAPTERLVELWIEDPQAQGIVLRRGFSEDFEASGGGFTAGDSPRRWSWGAPSGGLGFARSGERAWWINAKGVINGVRGNFLETPAWDLPPVAPAGIEFWHWLTGDRFQLNGNLFLSVDGGPFLAVPGVELRGNSPRYERVNLDLSEYAGRPVKLRFELADGERAWFIDDLKVSGPSSSFRALDPDGDFDGDGVLNREEERRGTDPLSGDTDGDGLSDGSETATGKFSGEDDTGTDPLRTDSDDGGMPDGEEAFFGVDPGTGQDDFAPVRLPVTLADGDGFRWSFDWWGEIHGVPAFDRSMILTIEEGGVPMLGHDARQSRTGETVLVGPEVVNRLDLTRQVLVPGKDGGFARFLDVFRNPGKADVKTACTWSVNLPWSFGSRTFGTSSGDLKLTPADDWIVTADASRQDLPFVTLVLAGSRARLRPREARVSGESLNLTYDLEVPAGGAVSVLHFAARSADLETALAKARDLSRLAGRAREGLRSPAGRSVYNFGVDSDGDGVPDVDELRLGLDPDDPADAGGDLDGDGLSNLEEFLAGSDLRIGDTDGDGLGDREEVKEKGTDPARADTDGDGRQDGEDPFPRLLILVRLLVPTAAVAGVPVPVRLTLTAGEEPVPVPVPFTLRLSGGAVFADEARRGNLVSGGGTGEAELESDGGEVEIDILSRLQGPVSFTLADPQGYGISFHAEVFEDFESGDGGFTHGGSQDEWEWGVPRVGPIRGRSGRRAWGTDLDANYNDRAASWLQTPTYDLPRVSGLTLEWWQWMATADGDAGRFYLSIDEGAFVEFPEVGAIRDTSRAYQLVRLDLTPYAGHSVKFRFELTSDGSLNGEGWYLDDFRIFGPPLELKAVAPAFGAPKPLTVLGREGDADRDGLSNGEELARGTSPYIADTDGGGLMDGEEVGLGIDPLDPGDDVVFVRGDSNADLKVRLTDAVMIINYLFLGGPPPQVLDAADVDDNGSLEITDPVLLLHYLFLGGSPPAPPFPEPGPDRTADDLRE